MDKGQWPDDGAETHEDSRFADVESVMQEGGNFGRAAYVKETDDGWKVGRRGLSDVDSQTADHLAEQGWRTKKDGLYGPLVEADLAKSGNTDRHLIYREQQVSRKRRLENRQVSRGAIARERAIELGFTDAMRAAVGKGPRKPEQEAIRDELARIIYALARKCDCPRCIASRRFHLRLGLCESFTTREVAEGLNLGRTAVSTLSRRGAKLPPLAGERLKLTFDNWPVPKRFYWSWTMPLKHEAWITDMDRDGVAKRGLHDVATEILRAAQLQGRRLTDEEILKLADVGKAPVAVGVHTR